MPMKGWRGELERHNLASKGIKTKNMSLTKQVDNCADGIELERAVIVDLDGTIFDSRVRWKKASEKATPPSPAFWEYFMSDDFIKYDTPIKNSAKVLNYIKECGFKIIYLSGRRDEVKLDTEIAIEKYGFPEGEIILRKKGLKTEDFKIRELRRLKSEYNVAMMIGDSDSDKYVAMQTQTHFVRVLQNDVWNKTDVENIKTKMAIGDEDNEGLV